jgi:hypothetical protein
VVIEYLLLTFPTQIAEQEPQIRQLSRQAPRHLGRAAESLHPMRLLR